MYSIFADGAHIDAESSLPLSFDFLPNHCLYFGNEYKQQRFANDEIFEPRKCSCFIVTPFSYVLNIVRNLILLLRVEVEFAIKMHCHRFQKGRHCV